MLTGEYLLIKPSFLAQYCLSKKTEKDDYDYKSERFIEKKERILNIFSIDDEGNAHINISGPLTMLGPDDWDIYFNFGGTSYQNIINSLDRADREIEKDKKIILDMNTPGGEVNGVEMTRNKIMELRKTRNIETHINGLMASAGVWIGSASNNIISNTSTSMIGSIGVVVNYLDWSGLYEKWGIKEITITNHESPDKWPNLATEKGQDIIRVELDDIYDVFVSQVIEGRQGKITRDQINDLNGRVLISEKAEKIKLIDEILNSSNDVTLNNDDKKVKKDDIIIEGNKEKSKSELQNSVLITENQNNGGQFMTLEEFKIQNPEIYNQVFESGITAGIAQELKRCTSYVEAMAILPEAKEIYIKAIKEQKDYNDPSINASVMSLMKAQKTIDDSASDNATDIKTEKIEVDPAGKVDGEITTDKDLKATQDLIRVHHQINTQEVN